MTWTAQRARVAGLSKSRDADDPELAEAKHDLKVARLEDHIRELVAAAPPLTAEQRVRLAGLLVGGAQ